MSAAGLRYLWQRTAAQAVIGRWVAAGSHADAAELPPQGKWQSVTF